MTKKDFQVIADVLNIGDRAIGLDLKLGAVDLLDLLIVEFIVRLQKDNPRFDSEKFRKACFRQ